MQKFENLFLPIANKLAANHYLIAIREGFVVNLCIISVVLEKGYDTYLLQKMVFNLQIIHFYTKILW